jgi:predicted ATPase/class 3 adenylate cyclase
LETVSGQAEPPLPGHRPAGAERPAVELVTLLFTDIEGSTELARRLGPAGWTEALGEHHRILAEAIERHRGRVVDTEGDAFLAFFSDAGDAVRAAQAAQLGLASHDWPHGLEPVKVRMGLHTGVVERQVTGYVGLDLHLAARVAAAANGGQILISSAARRRIGDAIETRDLGEHRLKDFPEPERLYHVFVEGVEAAPRPRTQTIRPTNLPPQPRALVGREREQAEVLDLLGAGSGTVVTLTGVGGIGKTRLAVAVGLELLEEAPGGVFLVRLAGMRDADAINPMIAEAAGIIGEAGESLISTVASRLGERPAVLILDNFEQLVSAAPLVADLAGRAEQLRVLITSQVPLRISAERIYPLGPLAGKDAVQLFMERAQARVPEFAPGEEEQRAIEEICARLDGMPLGIELAAARLRVLDPLGLARRLEAPLAVLTRGDRDVPERQRSLRATIDWTYELLDQSQRAVFEQMGVFAGPVPLQALEAVVGGGPSADLLDGLDSLLEASLVRRRGDRRLGNRFLMPQALRDYALERLGESGLDQPTRERHAEHVAWVGHEARFWKWGATPEQQTALLAIGQEIRPALAWARENRPELHVRLCAELASYLVYRGVISEVSEELSRARESGRGSPAERARITTLLAKCFQLEGRGELGLELADQALVEWQRVEDDQERAAGLSDLGWVYRWASRFDQALALDHESVAILRNTGPQALLARGLIFLANTLSDRREVEPTLAVVQEVADIVGDDPIWELDAIRGDCALYRGDYTGAIRLYARSLAWTSESGESHQALMDLNGLAHSLSAAEPGEAAVELGELARLQEEEAGRVGHPPAWAPDEHALVLARERVGDARVEAAITRARQVPPSERVQRALQLADEAVGAGARPPG